MLRVVKAVRYVRIYLRIVRYDDLSAFKTTGFKYLVAGKKKLLPFPYCLLACYAIYFVLLFHRLSARLAIELLFVFIYPSVEMNR